MKSIEQMTQQELKEVAKELKVKNWWTLKKAELLEEITKAQAAPEDKPEEDAPEAEKEIILPKLTKMEFEVMASIPEDDFYESGLESILWTDIFMDNCSIPNKQLRGVLSSLEQKEMLVLYSTKDKIDNQKGSATNSTISLNDLGKAWMTKYINKELTCPEAVEEKAEEEPKDENIITLKELIAEAKIKGTKARRLLRGSEIERPYKRWEWHKEQHQEIISKVRKILAD
jgi:hypothetical protein